VALNTITLAHRISERKENGILKSYNILIVL